jgi:hypothetical protein
MATEATMNIRTLLERGQAEQDRQHDEQEVAKRGNLRGGSAGVVGTDGKIYGECHRVALARLLGAEKDHEANRSIMFDAGRNAEDAWADKLRAAGCEIVREDEYPIVWPIPGTDKVVTGRPDILIGETEFFQAGTGIVQAKFTPQHGLELKGIYSASSAVRTEIEGVPDSKHLAQAGFYSMALNIPYTLCYTNPSVIEVPYWAQKKFGGPKKLQPFYRMFDLRWNAEVLEYKDEQSTEWVPTVYTKTGIVEYYQLVAEMEQKKDLGPRPTGGYATGEAPPYDRCNYCPFQDACDNHGDDFDHWLAAVKT